MARKNFRVLMSLLLMYLWSTGVSKALRQEECWWEIFLQLSSKGTYTLEEEKASYSGKYVYTIRWSGCMEQDGEDFILYHEDSELLRWEPQEKKRLLGSTEIMSIKKFIQKPVFAFNYILTKKENIHFDFLVTGVQVPQQTQNNRHYLDFPASKENSYHLTDSTYNLHIYKGSNQVYFSKDELLYDSIKKDFHWSWKRHFSSGGAEPSSYLSHSYDVDVEITVLRHPKE